MVCRQLFQHICRRRIARLCLFSTRKLHFTKENLSQLLRGIDIKFSSRILIYFFFQTGNPNLYACLRIPLIFLSEPVCLPSPYDTDCKSAAFQSLCTVYTFLHPKGVFSKSLRISIPHRPYSRHSPPPFPLPEPADHRSGLFQEDPSGKAGLLKGNPLQGYHNRRYL